MDLELNEEQQAFREAAREFAQARMAPFAAQWDAEHHFPKEVLHAGGELGFCGLYASPGIGGLGASRLSAAVVFEELATACPSTAAYFTIHNMATWMLGQWGTPEIKAQWGEALTSGRKIGSYCLTEPGSGSDAASLKTRAVREGEGYLISGSKAFISGGGSSDLLIVMARTGQDGPKGISAFAVPADAPGISYGRQEEKMGWHSQPTCGISFENVRVPLANRLGEEGEGFTFAMKGLDGGRINIASCSLGGAQAALDQARRYLGERRQFGKALSEFQALQFRLADMATNLVASRQMVHAAAAKLDSGSADASAWCAMAKRVATDTCFAVVDEALQLHGGYGYTREFPLERLLRDLRVHRILEGTNEVMRMIVARRLLGSDRELR